MPALGATREPVGRRNSERRRGRGVGPVAHSHHAEALYGDSRKRTGNQVFQRWATGWARYNALARAPDIKARRGRDQIGSERILSWQVQPEGATRSAGD